MSTQMVFERYERKYILGPEAAAAIKEELSDKMEIDRYGRSTISNLYFDTPDYRVIQTSLDATVYKEKLRMRSYGKVGKDDTVYVELKKKYNGIVYKRRIALAEFPAMDWLCAGGALPQIDPLEEKDQPNYLQIGYEIDYFRRRLGSAVLLPRVFLSYDREAYASRMENGRPVTDIRITFDTNIMARTTDLSLRSEPSGDYVLDPDLTVMEVKIPKDSAMPLWLAHCLSKNHIIRRSFSKYGTYYRTHLSAEIVSGIRSQGGRRYA